MTLQAHRVLAIASLVAGVLAYRSLAFWNPDPHGQVRFQDWLFSSVDAIPQMYFALAALLVYRNRGSFRRAMEGTGSPALAFLPLSLGSALFVWGHYVAATDLLLVSFVLVSMGVTLLWFGTGFAMAWSIPCVILAFAFPIPAALTNEIFYSLRLWTADQATALLTLVKFPVYHEGNVIYGANVVAQVIDSCSGLRAMEMLTLAAFLFVQWSPADRLRGWLLIATAPLVAYGFNLLRVCFIIPDPTSDLSATHTVQGWAAFFGALAVLVVIDRLLGRLLPGRGRPRSTSFDASDRPQPAAGVLALASSRAGAWSVALAAMLASLLGISLWMPEWSPPEGEGSAGEPIFGPSVELPLAMGGWRMGEALPLDLDYIWTLRFPQYANRPYRLDGQTVDLFIGYGDRADRSRSLLSTKNALPGRGWEVEDRSFARLDSWGTQVERVVARSGSRRILTYHWYEGMDSLALEVLRALFATDQSPLWRSQRPRVVRIGTPVGVGAPEEAEADSRLMAFAGVLAKALPESGSNSRVDPRKFAMKSRRLGVD
ncbi:MAG: EpsI family protein [Deltaproteobacteria bacterium]|nr:EpsI family protein [Deltaproteobacteria bacterium]